MILKLSCVSNSSKMKSEYTVPCQPPTLSSLPPPPLLAPFTRSLYSQPSFTHNLRSTPLHGDRPEMEEKLINFSTDELTADHAATPILFCNEEGEQPDNAEQVAREKVGELLKIMSGACLGGRIFDIAVGEDVATYRAGIYVITKEHYVVGFSASGLVWT